MNGKNSSISNCRKMQLLLLSTFLNQFITVSVSVHWFTNDLSLIIVFAFPIKNLLTLPNSLFNGLINLPLGLVVKLGLWSFKVMKASVISKQSTLSAISKSINSLCCGGHFLLLNIWSRWFVCPIWLLSVKWAFHLNLFIKGSTLFINVVLYSFSDGIGIFFIE